MVPEDVNLRISLDFPDPEERALVASIISDLATDFPPRILRCVLYVARGDLDRLGEAERLGRIDYRDIIVVAEYDDSLKQVRDFNQPFTGQET
jgi:hypothetical protein